MDADIKKAIAALCELEVLELDPHEFDWDEAGQRFSFRLYTADEAFHFPKRDFLQLATAYKELKIDRDGSTVRTSRSTFKLVMPISSRAELLNEKGASKLSVELEKGVRISLRTRSFWVTVAALQRKAYESDYLPADSYRSVEIEYGGSAKQKTESEEEQLVTSYLFELAASEGLAFGRSGLITDAVWNELFDDAEFKPKLRPLERFNEGMRLYLAALQVHDSELRLLSLFKVLEFFAPIVMALDSNEALRKKLDSPSALCPDANFLQSIQSLARSLERRRSDTEMMRLVFGTCFDFVELSAKLPQARFHKLSYDDKKSEIESQTRTAADILVATRNQVAHAKSDYTPTGNELNPEEFGAFNTFLEAAAVQTIRWYNRLPTHLRISF